MNDINFLQNLDLKYSNSPIIYKGDYICNELVSIIMPLYNNSKYIKRAIHSAISQQKVNIELIIIDDGSTDNSIDIAYEISRNYNNIRIIPLLRNFGCYYARNIGILESKGTYISLHDSDDIIHPKMLYYQLSNLLEDNNAVACQCKLQRWDETFTNYLTSPNYGENTLLWKKDIISKIGYYDNVRFGGDTEFRCRIKKVYGINSIKKVDKILYGVRTRKNSLTTSHDSSAFTITTDGNLKLTLNNSRKNYVEYFSNWHKTFETNDLYIPWPQCTRNFKLGSNEQNASPSLGQKIIGTMATFPERKEILERTIEHILPQVDKLIIYLNDYTEVPIFLNHKKIESYLGNNFLGDLKDNGKFFKVEDINNAYIFTFDDDIIYPSDYVKKLIHYIEVFNRTCIVGVHGTIFNNIEFKEIHDRIVYSFTKKSLGHFVDMLGTGTTAWHSSTINIKLNDFPNKGQCDIYFAALALKKYIPLFSIPRDNHWLKQAQEPKSNSIYLQTLNDPTYYFKIFKSQLYNILKNNFRQDFENQILNALGHLRILCSNIEIKSLDFFYNHPTIKTRKTIINLKNKFYPRVKKYFFHIIIYKIDNEHNNIATLLRSIALQAPHNYAYDLTISDIGSNTEDIEVYSNSTLFNNIKCICFDNNTSLLQCLKNSSAPFKNLNSIVIMINNKINIQNKLLYNICNFLDNKKTDIIICDKFHDFPEIFIFKSNLYNYIFKNNNLNDILKNVNNSNYKIDFLKNTYV